jgi:hypothetical protein
MICTDKAFRFDNHIWPPFNAMLLALVLFRCKIDSTVGLFDVLIVRTCATKTDYSERRHFDAVYLKLGIAPLIEDAIADNILATMGRLGCALAPQSSHLESVHLLAQHE